MRIKFCLEVNPTLNVHFLGVIILIRLLQYSHIIYARLQGAVLILFLLSVAKLNRKHTHKGPSHKSL